MNIIQDLNYEYSSEKTLIIFTYHAYIKYPDFILAENGRTVTVVLDHVNHFYHEKKCGIWLDFLNMLKEMSTFIEHVEWDT